jgi:hypothetical protein
MLSEPPALGEIHGVLTKLLRPEVSTSAVGSKIARLGSRGHSPRSPSRQPVTNAIPRLQPAPTTGFAIMQTVPNPPAPSK